MSEILKLKSKLIKEGNPYDVDITEFQVPLVPNQEIYERDLLNFRRKYSTIEEVSEVASQDMVTISCTSENARFCKEHLNIRVGMGLFSRELEEQLIGWTVGQKGTVTVKEQEVSVTVENIKRECLPEVNDELAARCNEAGIQTVADIHTYCKGKQFDDGLEEAADEAFAYISRETMEASEYDLDEDEVETCISNLLRDFANRPMFEDKVMDEIPDDFFAERFGVSKAELIENFKVSGKYIVEAALLGQEMLARDGKLVTMEDYENYLNRYRDEGDKTEEEIRKEHTVFEYVVNFYSDAYMEMLEALALCRLKENIQ